MACVPVLLRGSGLVSGAEVDADGRSFAWVGWRDGDASGTEWAGGSDDRVTDELRSGRRWWSRSTSVRRFRISAWARFAVQCGSGPMVSRTRRPVASR
jgi:hypothetical protein